MVLISYLQALCTFYCLDYNNENIEKALILVNDPPNKYDICYYSDTNIPVLSLKENIKNNSSHCKQYIKLNEAIIESEFIIDTHAQALCFLGNVYTSYSGVDRDLYTARFVTIRDIFSNMLQFTASFDTYSLNKFNQFCELNLEFVCKNTEQKKIRVSGNKYTTYWRIFVLKEIYQVHLAKKVERHKRVI
ncbi:unnamed protein product [Rhizopus stolonifer]